MRHRKIVKQAIKSNKKKPASSPPEIQRKPKKPNPENKIATCKIFASGIMESLYRSLPVGVKKKARQARSGHRGHVS
ncbi:MAG: hypothetical protein FWF77_07355 [Defluviitaleaceae bacterium]|nr:hypothetical protein [Defluviitaleaceae bacterium]